LGGLLGLFLNPWALAAAGLLASIPVIIHLINRMRYRRVRWAAMEFLLAAQKRMKRKMIIEQMLLLASRVLLVLLAGLLLSRWLFSGAPPAPPEDWILHEVVLDDSASMSDTSRDAGAGADCFALAKDGIRSLGESALSAKTPTRLRLRRASEPDKVLFDEQVGDESLATLVTLMETAKLRAYQVNASEAIGKAKADLLAQYPDQKCKRHLHFYSDMRKADWEDGSLRALMNQAEGVLWRVHDCAVPARVEDGRPESHGNLAVVALGSESRLALDGQPMECWAKIANYGTQARSAFLAIELNGKRDPSASRQVESLPPGQVVEVRFRIIPSRGESDRANQPAGDPRPNAGEAQDPARQGLSRRAVSSLMAVRVHLENESGEGLAADNARDMLLEVRDRIPLLVVDGTIQPGASTSSDSLYFGAALNPQLFDPLFLETADLEKQDLPSFALVVLLNVGELTDNALARLSEFVRGGGGLAWFTGDRTVPAFCNRAFEQDGLFPLLLAGQPSPSLSEKEREEMRRDESPKVVFPDPASPVVAGLLPFRSVFRHLRMERHWPSIDPSRWSDRAETLLALPSKGWQVAGQRETVKREILDVLALDKTPFTAPSLAPVLPGLEAEIGKVRSRIATQGQFEIVTALEELLRMPPPGSAGQAGATLWDRAELRETQAKLRGLIRKIQQGDPLLVARDVGKGKTLAFLSSAGPASSRGGVSSDSPAPWNEWANGFLSATFPILVQDSLFYLLRQQSDSRSRLFAPQQVVELGTLPNPVVVESLYFPQSEAVVSAASGRGASVAKVAARLLPGTAGNGSPTWSIGIDAQENPGLLTYAVRPDPASPLSVRGGAAFNVDIRESDLERAEKVSIDPRGDNGKPGDATADWFSLESAGPSGAGKTPSPRLQRPLDASETPWLILALLALLVIEQFLAWRCSHLQPVQPPAAVKGGA
jgi:hypothetical protein